MTAIVIAASTSAAHSQQVHSLAEDAAAFGARPAVVEPHLSPDGSSVIYITPGQGAKNYAVISNLETGKSTVMTGSSGAPDILRWCDFAAADRAVCRVTATNAQTKDLIGFERLIAMNLDGAGQKTLGQPASFYDANLRQADANVLDWGNRTDGSLLMERQYVPEAGKMGTRLVRSKQGLGVDRVDTRSLRAVPIEAPDNVATGYMSDGRGNVRIMRIDDVGSDGTLSGMVRYQYRTAGSHDWRPLAGNVREEDQLQPLAVDADSNLLYALRKKDGRYALYSIRLDGSGTESLIAANPRVDIDDVVRVGSGLKIIGYSYTDEKPHIVYFDPEFRALADSLSKALPNFPIVQFVDATANGQKLLIYAGSDTDPGRYYLFDRTKKTLNEAMLERPQLEGHSLAHVTSVVIPAADGAQIPAYLTLPTSGQSKNLPAVVLPHGGPSARDDGGFDWLAQFLAARGYAVLQPEYRGSSGFGDQWLNQNGFRNWRAAMSDIASSARWLQSQGIASAGRIAIVGWSYGGYAALMEAETDPKLYKAVVAIAPVTDLNLLKQEESDYNDSRVVKDFVGSGDEAIAGSPLRHADAIQVPVLLAHGDLDTNVRFEQSQKMAGALEAAGRNVAFLSYKGLDHQLADANARTDLLTHIAQMLDQAIGH